MTRVMYAWMGACLLLVQGCARGQRSASAEPAGQVKAEMTNTSRCSVGDLRLSFDGKDGEFTGMSHDGALLTLKNIGKQACTVPRRPALVFTDADGRPIPLHAHVPVGMHPGPVMVPVTVAPGASAQGTMRWVVGPVYDTNTCVDTAKASLTVRDGDLSVPFKAHVCGPSPGRLEYEQEFMKPMALPVAPDAAH
jgi:hypothetical protein